MIKKYNKLFDFSLYFLILFLFFLHPLFADLPEIDLLGKSLGVRPLALGSAFVAQAESIFASSWNPAGLSLISSANIGTNYVSLFGDIVRFSLTAGLPTDFGNFSVVFLRESSSGFPLTILDENGRPVIQGYFDEKREAVALSWAKNLFFPNFSTGVNLKVYRHSLGSETASNYGLDLGALLKPVWQLNPTNKINLGLMARNVLATKPRWPSGHIDQIAREFTLGLGWESVICERPAIFLFDYDFWPKEFRRSHLGVEYQPVNDLAFRLGLDNGGLTAGLGIFWNNFEFDYAYLGHADLGASHQVSLGYLFEKINQPEAVETPKLEAKPEVEPAVTPEVAAAKPFTFIIPAIVKRGKNLEIVLAEAFPLAVKEAKAVIDEEEIPLLRKENIWKGTYPVAVDAKVGNHKVTLKILDFNGQKVAEETEVTFDLDKVYLKQKPARAPLNQPFKITAWLPISLEISKAALVIDKNQKIQLEKINDFIWEGEGIIKKIKGLRSDRIRAKLYCRIKSGKLLIKNFDLKVSSFSKGKQ